VSIFKKISTKFIGITPEDETEENEEQKGAPVAEIGARASRPRETGAKIYTLDPVVTGEATPAAKDAYLDTMRKNMNTLKEALQ